MEIRPILKRIKPSLLAVFGAIIVTLLVFQNCQGTKNIGTDSSSSVNAFSSPTPIPQKALGTIVGTLPANHNPFDVKVLKANSEEDSALNKDASMTATCLSTCHTPHCAEIFFYQTQVQDFNTVFCKTDLLKNSQSGDYEYKFEIENMAALAQEIYHISAEVPKRSGTPENQIRQKSGRLKYVQQIENITAANAIEELFVEAKLRSTNNPDQLETYKSEFNIQRLFRYFAVRKLLNDDKTTIEDVLPEFGGKSFESWWVKLGGLVTEIAKDLSQLDPNMDGSLIEANAKMYALPLPLNQFRQDFLKSIDTDGDKVSNYEDCDSSDSEIYQLKTYLLKESGHDCGLKQQYFCIGDELAFKQKNADLISDRQCTDADLKASCWVDILGKEVIKHGEFITGLRYKSPYVMSNESCLSVEVRRYCHDGVLDHDFKSIDPMKNWTLKECFKSTTKYAKPLYVANSDPTRSELFLRQSGTLFSTNSMKQFVTRLWFPPKVGEIREVWVYVTSLETQKEILLVKLRSFLNLEDRILGQINNEVYILKSLSTVMPSDYTEDGRYMYEIIKVNIKTNERIVLDQVKVKGGALSVVINEEGLIFDFVVPKVGAIGSYERVIYTYLAKNKWSKVILPSDHAQEIWAEIGNLKQGILYFRKMANDVRYRYLRAYDLQNSKFIEIFPPLIDGVSHYADSNDVLILGTKAIVTTESSQFIPGTYYQVFDPSAADPVAVGNASRMSFGKIKDQKIQSVERTSHGFYVLERRTDIVTNERTLYRMGISATNKIVLVKLATLDLGKYGYSSFLDNFQMLNPSTFYFTGSECLDIACKSTTEEKLVRLSIIDGRGQLTTFSGLYPGKTIAENAVASLLFDGTGLYIRTVRPSYGAYDEVADSHFEYNRFFKLLAP